MKEIKLFKNRGVALVDDEDYEFLNQYKWHLRNDGYSGTSFRIENKKNRKLMHRLIINVPNGMYIDHIDNNRLNNQKNNLRIVTPSQNGMNRKKGIGCSSKYKGVCWDKSRNKWIVNICVNKKHIHLGRFDNEIDAAKTYNKTAIKLFGKYAILNEV